MSHLIKIYAVCKFSYFRHWQSKSLKFVILLLLKSGFILLTLKLPRKKIVESVNSVDPDEVALIA